MLNTIGLRLAPVAGYDPRFPENLYSLWLPAFVLNLHIGIILARILQSSIIDTLDQEFVEVLEVMAAAGWGVWSG